jgi:serine protease Do
MCLLRSFILTVCTASVPATGVCQQATARPTAEAGGPHRVVSRLPTDMLARLNDSLRQLASTVAPAVVQIEVTGFGPAESDDRKQTALIVRQRAIGAGIIVDSDGYIMTNAHVVDGAQRVRVVVSRPVPASADWASADRTQVLEARVIGSERQADLALLKVDATDLATVPFNLERTPQPGELVFAVGSPNGLQNSITMGVISSAWRQPDPDNPMVYLQTDAPINPGNSGGPLVDVTGAVVGLNTFIMSSGGGSNGLGFAIPARIVDFVYQSLKKNGRVDHTDIGVVAQTITPAMAGALGLPQEWGVVVADVLPHGPADVAGLLPEDVILAVDRRPVMSLTAFTVALYQHPPQQVVEVDLLRGSQKLSFALPDFLAWDRPNQFGDVTDPAQSHIERLGILGLDFDRVRPLLPGGRMDTGVLVLGQAPGFDSVDTGLRAGDVIHRLNRTPIASVAQLKAAVADLNRGNAVVLRIERLGQFHYLTFELD